MIIQYLFSVWYDPYEDSSLPLFQGWSMSCRAFLSKWAAFAQGRASILLSERLWFDSPGLHVEVSLGKILNPKLLLMCWLAPCIAATTISVWMYVWITVSLFGQKRLLKCPKLYMFAYASVLAYKTYTVFPKTEYLLKKFLSCIPLLGDNTGLSFFKTKSWIASWTKQPVKWDPCETNIHRTECFIRCGGTWFFLWEIC